MEHIYQKTSIYTQEQIPTIRHIYQIPHVLTIRTRFMIHKIRTFRTFRLPFKAMKILPY